MVLAIVFLSMILFLAGAFSVKYQSLFLVLILYFLCQVYFFDFIFQVIHPVPISSGETTPSLNDVLNDSIGSSILLVPVTSFMFGKIVLEVFSFIYRAGEYGVTPEKLFREFWSVFNSEKTNIDLTPMAAVVSLATRFISPQPNLGDFTKAKLNSAYSDADISAYLNANYFVSASVLNQSFSKSTISQIYEDVIKLAIAVKCLDDNTMQRMMVSATQAGLSAGDFIGIIDRYNIGDIWDGLTPEEAAKRKREQAHSQARSRSQSQRQSYRSADQFGQGTSSTATGRTYVSEKSRKLAFFGLSPSAGLKELKKAYRKMAIKYHPDRNTGPNPKVKNATEKMAELNTAYDWLVDNW